MVQDHSHEAVGLASYSTADGMALAITPRVGTTAHHAARKDMRRLLILALIVTAALVIWANAAGNESVTSTITLSPLTLTLQLDETATVTATAYDELGNAIPDALIQWLPSQFDPEPHCVMVRDGVITARMVGKCGVGALTVTHAGRLILHQVPVSVTVVGEQPSPEPSIEPSPQPTVEPTATPTPTPDKPCRLPNGKCRRGCICR